MNGCVAVFDIGKTNMKVVVFDAAGKVAAERGHPNASIPPDARWPYGRLQTEGAWAFLIGALKELGAQFPVEAISISAHGAAGVLVGDTDAAAPAVDYEFDIGGDVAAEYDKLRPRSRRRCRRTCRAGSTSGARSSTFSADSRLSSRPRARSSPIRNIGRGA